MGDSGRCEREKRKCSFACFSGCIPSLAFTEQPISSRFSAKLILNSVPSGIALLSLLPSRSNCLPEVHLLQQQKLTILFLNFILQTLLTDLNFSLRKDSMKETSEFFKKLCKIAIAELEFFFFSKNTRQHVKWDGLKVKV